MKTEQYLTNCLTEMKREALLSKDVEILRLTRAYEERGRNERIYYVREGETTIRDKEGNEIDPTALPFRQSETSMHFYQIIIGARYSMMKDAPGDLMRDMRFSSNHGNEWSAMILEVPGRTEFPIQGGFVWWIATCLEYVKTDEYSKPARRSSYRLDGRPKYTTYRYEINGNRIITSQPPSSNVPYTTNTE